MIVGIYVLEFHLPAARSLKDKRQVLRHLKDRFRSRHNVAVSELEEHSELLQRAGLAIVSVSSSRDVLLRLFDTLRREAESHVPGQVIETAKELLESADGGPQGWGEGWA